MVSIVYTYILGRKPTTFQSRKRDTQVAVGSRGSVIRAPAAKARGPGFDPR